MPIVTSTFMSTGIASITRLPTLSPKPQTFIGYKDSKWTMRFPCGGYSPGPVTNMRAGQTVNVRFFASSMKPNQIKSQPKPTSPNRQFSQARHGGGMVSVEQLKRGKWSLSVETPACHTMEEKVCTNVPTLPALSLHPHSHSLPIEPFLVTEDFTTKQMRKKITRARKSWRREKDHTNAK